jgi:diacylglycerol kinase (ATP)
VQAYELKINSGTFSEKAFLLSFANGSQFGNNAFISPNSKITDGSGELCILQKVPPPTHPLFCLSVIYKKDASVALY